MLAWLWYSFSLFESGGGLKLEVVRIEEEITEGGVLPLMESKYSGVPRIRSTVYT